MFFIEPACAFLRVTFSARASFRLTVSVMSPLAFGAVPPAPLVELFGFLALVFWRVAVVGKIFSSAPQLE
jgi:hypothetical protein